MVIRVIAKHYAGLRVVADCYRTSVTQSPDRCICHRRSRFALNETGTQHGCLPRRHPHARCRKRAHPICAERVNIPVFCHGTRARRTPLCLALKGCGLQLIRIVHKPRCLRCKAPSTSAPERPRLQPRLVSLRGFADDNGERLQKMKILAPQGKVGMLRIA